MSTTNPTTTQPEDPPITTPHDNNETDSIWGSPPASPSTAHPHHQSRDPHPSDIPRLQQSHTNAGYREGITAAKAYSVQPGFDEGFSLGATIGARAGELLGVLEGIVAALLTSHSTFSSQSVSAPAEEEARRLSQLLEEARKELSVQVMFGREYWEEDGTWKYEVPDGVVFRDVAGAHPMLRKWEGVVKAEGRRYGVDWDILKGEEGRMEEDGEGAVVERREGKGGGGGKGVLEW